MALDSFCAPDSAPASLFRVERKRGRAFYPKENEIGGRLRRPYCGCSGGWMRREKDRGAAVVYEEDEADESESAASTSGDVGRAFESEAAFSEFIRTEAAIEAPGVASDNTEAITPDERNAAAALSNSDVAGETNPESEETPERCPYVAVGRIWRRSDAIEPGAQGNAVRKIKTAPRAPSSIANEQV